MGKRSQARTRWKTSRDVPAGHIVRIWICAGCRARGYQLITCMDGRQRCPGCKAAFDAQQTLPAIASGEMPSPILPPGQPVQPPRVG